MYGNTKAIVEREFGAAGSYKPGGSGSKSEPPKPPTPGGIDPESSTQKQVPPPPPPPLARALLSFKVLTECPIAVVLIFQTFKSVIQSAMLDFYPLVIESIKIQPEPQKWAHANAAEKGELFVGVADGVNEGPRSRDMYAELIKAQVKVSHGICLKPCSC